MTEQKCPLDDALAAFASRNHAKGKEMLVAIITDAADKPEQQMTKFKALVKLAAHQSLMGDFEEADRSFASAHTIAQSAIDNFTARELAEFYKDFGFLFDQQSKEAEAVKHYSLAKKHYAQAIANDAAIIKSTNYSQFLTCYAKATEKIGENDLALELFHEVLPIMESTHGVASGTVGLVRNALARLLEKLGKSEASAVLRQEERHLAGFKQTPILLALPDSVRALQSMGLLSEFKLDELPESVKNNKVKSADNATDVFNLLLQYYFDEGKGEGRAESDSYIAHDYKYRKETDDLPAELCKLIGQPILTQVSYKQRADQQGRKRMCLGLRRDDGVGICIAEPSMEAVVDVFNAVLKDRGDKRRFFQLFSEDRIIAYYLLTIDEAQELSNIGALGFDDMHRSLNSAIDHFEKFTTWPGEVKPKHLKRFKCKGSKKIVGNYLVNTSGDTSTVYDLTQWPPKALFELELNSVYSFGRSEAGDWFFIGRSKRAGFVGYNLLLIKNNQSPENAIWLKDSATVPISNRFEGQYLGEILFVFAQGTIECPKVLADNALVAVEGLTPPAPGAFALDVKGTLAKTNSGQNYLMWVSHFYRRENNEWKECPEWDVPPMGTNMVADGADGLLFLAKGVPYRATPGKEPIKLMNEPFMTMTVGPRNSVVLHRPAVWQTGVRNLLLFPDSGKEIDFDDEIFGSPNEGINDVVFLPDSNKMISTNWDEVLAFPADQLI